MSSTYCPANQMDIGFLNPWRMRKITLFSRYRPDDCLKRVELNIGQRWFPLFSTQPLMGRVHGNTADVYKRRWFWYDWSYLISTSCRLTFSAHDCGTKIEGKSGLSSVFRVASAIVEAVFILSVMFYFIMWSAHLQSPLANVYLDKLFFYSMMATGLLVNVLFFRLWIADNASDAIHFLKQLLDAKDTPKEITERREPYLFNP